MSDTPLPSDEGGPRPPPLPKRRKKIWKILLLAVGIPVGVATLIFSLGLCMYTLSKELPVTASDRAVLVTAAVMAEANDWFEPVASGETITKLRLFDGSFDLTYQYEHPDAQTEDYVYYYDDADGIEALLRPILERLEVYDP